MHNISDFPLLYVGVGEFIRSLDLSWAGIWSFLVNVVSYQYYKWGWVAVIAVLIAIYTLLMYFPATRGVAGLMLNTLFRVPIDVSRDISKGLVNVMLVLGKLIISSIRGGDDDGK